MAFLKKLIIGVIVLAVVAAGAGYLVLSSRLLDVPLADLETKYKLPQSQFADIDCVRVHYTDEGAKDAPVLVLLHASFMSLRSWDDMVAALSPQFRIIRLDFLTAGLTGPDPKNDYSTEHNMALVDELTKKLGIESFFLLGTSSGGTVAYRYAAAHPEKVKRLILINSAGMPRTAVTNPNRPRGTTLSRWIEAHYKSRAYWVDGLNTNFTSVPPSPALVDMVYDMNRRKGGEVEGLYMLKAYHNGGPEETLAKIKAPTFIMWGIENPTVMHLEANVFQLWLTGAPSLIKKYPKVAHYFYLEIGPEVHKDIIAFLTGGLDGDLRQTQRLTAADMVKVGAN